MGIGHWALGISYISLSPLSPSSSPASPAPSSQLFLPYFPRSLSTFP
ncbi:hypothetical protein COO91_02155 [Nostoc flagelliforme CCNUN1]|uniref:Uncharacterized protein n=1 Tax=Nostoc flagelliforme CCNUN1 TaxID=2038116 RepID=A0A2K8SLD2_9NOSO|nr:hypothetical protein COO91_02155 [Nostoc flagelliforme CCNUN1]